MGLNLYSKVEDLFLDKEVANKLWQTFIDILKAVSYTHLTLPTKA